MDTADPVPPVLAVAEIARLLGVSASRVHALVADPGGTFPPPYAVLAAATVWRREDVEAWRDEHIPVCASCGAPVAERFTGRGGGSVGGAVWVHRRGHRPADGHRPTVEARMS